jgi:hypothetical protein
MSRVGARWEQMRGALQAEIAGHPEVVRRIRGWEPVDLAMGLRWLQSTIYEGFSVAYRITSADEEATVWFKRWEYGEPEPSWPE